MKISFRALLALLSFLLIIPTGANAQMPMQEISNSDSYQENSSPDKSSVKEDLDQMTVGISRNVVQTPDGQRFDVAKAKRSRESARVIEAGENYNLVMNAKMTAKTGSGASTQAFGVSVPIWGKWCGPGHSGPAAPKDTLDTLCMRHDKCYAARGYFNCYCDAQLKAEIDRFSGRMGARERTMAAAVKMAFSGGLGNPF